MNITTRFDRPHLRAAGMVVAGLIALLAPADYALAERTNRIPAALQTPANPVAGDIGFWGDDGTQSIDVLLFQSPGEGSPNGWNIYETCAGVELWHPQHIVRLPNKNGRAYFMVSQSDYGGGFITVLQTRAGHLDPITDLVIPDADGNPLGDYIWADGYPDNQSNPIGAWNHPGKMEVIGDLLVVAAQNWEPTFVCGAGWDDYASIDVLLFYDVSDPAQPRYLGFFDEDELGVNEISVINIARTPDGEYLLTAGGDGRFALLKSDRVSTRPQDWIRLEGNGTGFSFGGQHGMTFSSYNRWHSLGLPLGEETIVTFDTLFSRGLYEDGCNGIPFDFGRKCPLRAGFTGFRLNSNDVVQLTGGATPDYSPALYAQYTEIPYRPFLFLDSDDELQWATDSLYVTTDGRPIIYDLTTTGGAAGAFVYQVTSSPLNAAGPVNDAFAGATSISGNTGAATGTNAPRWPRTGATRQAGEPNHGGNAGGASVWWTFTAPANGILEVNTYGSDFDTTLGVYTGGSVSAMTQLGTNDDASSSNCASKPFGLQSCVSLEVTQGTTYRIAVDGYNGAVGEISLQWSNAVFNLVITSVNDSGAGSLRQAIADLPPGGTATFAPGFAGATIQLNSPLFLEKDVTISGASVLGLITLRGNGSSGVIRTAGVEVSIESLTITGGNEPLLGGGGINVGTNGVMTLTDMVVRNNNTAGAGGGIRNNGTLTLVDSTVRDNTATDVGGGIFNAGNGTLTVRHSTLSGNSTSSGLGGGALANYGAVSATNVTLAGNSAASGGGIYNASGGAEVTLVHATIAANQADDGGGIWNVGTLRLDTSIVAGNTGGTRPDIRNQGTVEVGGPNLVGVNASVSAVLPAGPLVGTLASPVDPSLAALAGNGGPTRTVLPRYDSPAIDAAAGGIDSPAFDQRGFLRPRGPRYDIGAIEVPAIYGTVTSFADTGAEGTLRQVLAAAPPGWTLEFDSALNGAVIDLGIPLVLTQDVTISAANLADGVTLNGAGVTRVIEIEEGLDITIEGVTIANGAAVNGAGIENLGSNLTVVDSTLSGNHASGSGGAIINFGGNLTLENTTVADNSAVNSGGGVYNGQTVDTVLTVRNSTFTGNGATNGGAISNFRGAVSLVHATLARNSASGLGGGIRNGGGTLEVENSIVAGNTAAGSGPDIHSNTSVAATGANLVGDNVTVETEFPSGPLAGTAGALVEPGLAPLADNGGPTRTLRLLAGSPAIDAAVTTAASPAHDQRGDPRPVGAADDIGAVEVSDVTTLADDGSEGSLRQILDAAPDGAVLSFSPRLNGQTIILNSTLNLTRDVTLSAADLPDGVTLDGNGAVRVMHLDAGVEVALENLTIRGGSAAGNGGGIENIGADLTLIDAMVLDNHATSYGGGIINFGGTLTLENSTLADNTASNGGGALYNGNVAESSIVLRNVTLTRNGAVNGGAIYNFLGEVSLNHVTVVNNDASGQAGGIRNIGGTFSIENSVVAVNTDTAGNPDFYSNTPVTATGQNFIGDNASVATTFPAGAFAGTAASPADPRLGPLGDFGGATLTLLPLYQSPAIDAAPATAFTPAFDQRGEPRPAGTQGDIGAVEVPVDFGRRVSTTGDSVEGSLRRVIEGVVPGSVITFDPALDGRTIVVGSALELDKNITLDASNLPHGVVLDGNGSTRVISIEPGLQVALKGLTITGGNGLNGGGIENSGSVLSLTDMTVSGNHSTAYGGGVINFGGTLAVENSTISGNTATLGGGGLYNGNDAASVVTLTNTTLAGNSAANGGGLYNYLGEVTLVHTTTADNSASVKAGGIDNEGGTLHFENSIVARNTDPGAAPDFYSNVPVDATGQNLVGDNASVAASFPAGEFVGTTAAVLDPKLAVLGAYGGSTPTLRPFVDSPVIDAAVTTTSSPAGDQGGTLRPVGARNDIGAVEYAAVTTTADDGSQGSLRQALATAPAGVVLTFAPDLNGATIALGSELVVVRDVTISALGLPDGVTLDGGNSVRVLRIQPDKVVRLEGLTIAHGRAEFGGGGIDNAGALTLANVTVRDNTATEGGGIRNNPGTLTLVDTTVRDNHASSTGGGIISGSSLEMRIENSTFANNTADVLGGALVSYGGTVTVVNTTVAGNRSADTGGLFSSGAMSLTYTTVVDNHATGLGGGVRTDGTLHIENSIVAANTGGSRPDIRNRNTVTAAGVNLVGDNASVSAVIPAGPLVGTAGALVAPGLTPLGAFGGPTLTLRPLAGSPTIDVAAVAGATPATDQRGFARPVDGDGRAGSAPDLGAVEFEPLYDDLGAALDAEALTWSSAGDATWFGQAAITEDGVDALQSGALGTGQTSSVETVVEGPGTLTFWWKVSSAQGEDWLRFRIDDTIAAERSGEVDWQALSFAIEAGPHILRWTWTKSAAGAAGADAAWLDRVEFQATADDDTRQIPAMPAGIAALLTLLLLACAAIARRDGGARRRRPSVSG